jgi:hypothetical protein
MGQAPRPWRARVTSAIEIYSCGRTSIGSVAEWSGRVGDTPSRDIRPTGHREPGREIEPFRPLTGFRQLSFDVPFDEGDALMVVESTRNKHVYPVGTGFWHGIDSRQFDDGTSVDTPLRDAGVYGPIRPGDFSSPASSYWPSCAEGRASRGCHRHHAVTRSALSGGAVRRRS